MLNKKHDDKTGGYTDGQPKYVDGGKPFVSPKATEGDFDIILDHNEAEKTA
jgi:hypothetical protein